MVINDLIKADPEYFFGDESDHLKIFTVALDTVLTSSAQKLSPCSLSLNLLEFIARVERLPEQQLVLLKMINKRIEYDHLVEQLT